MRSGLSGQRFGRTSVPSALHAEDRKIRLLLCVRFPGVAGSCDGQMCSLWRNRDCRIGSRLRASLVCHPPPEDFSISTAAHGHGASSHRLRCYGLHAASHVALSEPSGSQHNVQRKQSNMQVLASTSMTTCLADDHVQGPKLFLISPSMRSVAARSRRRMCPERTLSQCDSPLLHLFRSAAPLHTLSNLAASPEDGRRPGRRQSCPRGARAASEIGVAHSLRSCPYVLGKPRPLGRRAPTQISLRQTSPPLQLQW